MIAFCRFISIFILFKLYIYCWIYQKEKTPHKRSFFLLIEKRRNDRSHEDNRKCREDKNEHREQDKDGRFCCSLLDNFKSALSDVL